MNKRISKKYLTEDEKLVLKLYHQCESAKFNIHNVQNPLDCFAFTDQVKVTSEFRNGGGAMWTTAGKGKIEVTAFLERKSHLLE